MNNKYDGVTREELIEQLETAITGGIGLLRIVDKSLDFLNAYLENKNDDEIMQFAQELCIVFTETDPELLKEKCLSKNSTVDS